MNLTTSRCETGDITTVYDLYGPDDAAQRVVLVHSLGMDRSYWRLVAERLAAQNITAVAIDCRGHGASGKPKGPYLLEVCADDIAGLLDHLGWPNAVIAGSSMGGSVALSHAVRHPERTSGLALIDTTAWYGPDAAKSWAQRAEDVRSQGLENVVDIQIQRWFSENFVQERPDIVQACVRTLLANDLDAYAATCRMLGNFDLRTALSGIKVPTAIVVGEEDFVTPPAMSEVLKDGLSNATYRVLPHCRHLTPLERPDEVTSEILQVLAKVVSD